MLFPSAPVAFLLTVMIAAPASAGPQQAAVRGLAVAQAHCAACHAIGAKGPSPKSPAPLFRDLRTHYPVADLIAAVGEGASTGHPAMPRFHLTLRQRRDLAVYVQSLEP
jgi:cytochrome c